jgi:tripartite-type tricarboxylate transporter receptor subunit TctC
MSFGALQPNGAPSRRVAVAGCLALLVSAAAGVAAEPAYPEKAITLVVPFPAGGSTDIAARILAERMSPILGQPIVIENRAGAAGAIGMRAVAGSAPDGYTLGVSGVGTSAILEAFGQKLGYSPERDLITVGHMGSLALVIASRSDLEANDLAQLIALAKARPGKLNYGTSGVGTPGHLAFEYLKLLAGIDVTHVPYKGNTPILNDLIGRHVDLGVLTIPGTGTQAKSGMVKPIAVTGLKRSSELPDVPTVRESGFPDYSADIWNILVAPRGTPPAILAKLSDALNSAMKQADVQQQFVAQGMTPDVMTSAETGDFVRREREKWADVVKKSGARMD